MIFKLYPIEWLVIILGFLSAIIIALPIISGPLGCCTKTANCANNLSQLTKAMYNYSISKSPVEGAFPQNPTSARGGDWWLILQQTGEVEEARIFTCAVSGVRPAAGKTSYRGPRVNPNAIASTDALGCDKPGNHGSDPDVAMNWVAKSGDVHVVTADASTWRRVLSQTRN